MKKIIFMVCTMFACLLHAQQTDNKTESGADSKITDILEMNQNNINGKWRIGEYQNQEVFINGDSVFVGENLFLLQRKTILKKENIAEENKNEKLVQQNEVDKILPSSRKTIIFDELTPIVTTSGEKYDVPANSYYVGTIRNGRIETGTLYDEKDKAIKAFFITK